SSRPSSTILSRPAPIMRARSATITMRIAGEGTTTPRSGPGPRRSSSRSRNAWRSLPRSTPSRREALTAPPPISPQRPGGGGGGVDVARGAWCWGREANGRLGRDGTPDNPAIPQIVSASGQFAQLAAGGAHTCSLDITGTGICWGADGAGQLGDGLGADRN